MMEEQNQEKIELKIIGFFTISDTDKRKDILKKNVLASFIVFVITMALTLLLGLLIATDNENNFTFSKVLSRTIHVPFIVTGVHLILGIVISLLVGKKEPTRLFDNEFNELD
jgi:hypothetical protein